LLLLRCPHYDPYVFSFFFSMTRPPPRSPLFPYTTLFRSAPRPRSFLGRYGWVGASSPSSSPASPCPPGLRPSNVSRTNSSSRSRSEEHTSELQSLTNLVCRLLLEKKKHTTQDDVRRRDTI